MRRIGNCLALLGALGVHSQASAKSADTAKFEPTGKWAIDTPIRAVDSYAISATATMT